MKALGRVEVPQEAFMAVLNLVSFSPCPHLAFPFLSVCLPAIL